MTGTLSSRGAGTAALVWLIAALTFAGMVRAENDQRLDMEGTSIRGNEEQPKVLFVIPWKARESVPLANEAPRIPAQPEIRPLERSEFRAGMYYRQHRAIGDMP